jgi:hypothetical protein
MKRLATHMTTGRKARSRRQYASAHCVWPVCAYNECKYDTHHAALHKARIVRHTPVPRLDCSMHATPLQASVLLAPSVDHIKWYGFWHAEYSHRVSSIAVPATLGMKLGAVITAIDAPPLAVSWLPIAAWAQNMNYRKTSVLQTTLHRLIAAACICLSHPRGCAQSLTCCPPQ